MMTTSTTFAGISHPTTMDAARHSLFTFVTANGHNDTSFARKALVKSAVLAEMKQQGWDIHRELVTDWKRVKALVLADLDTMDREA